MQISLLIKNLDENNQHSMNIKSMDDFVIPKNLTSILAENEYWQDDAFAPILITVEAILYHDEPTISFQAEFEVLTSQTPAYF